MRRGEFMKISAEKLITYVHRGFGIINQRKSSNPKKDYDFSMWRDRNEMKDGVQYVSDIKKGRFRDIEGR